MRLPSCPAVASRVAKVCRIEMPSRAAIEDEIAAMPRWGARLISSCKPASPKLIVALDPPPLLTILVKAPLFHAKAIAIVGAHDKRAGPRGHRNPRLVAGPLRPGTSGLIRRGAALVLHVQDVLGVLA